MFQLTLLLQVWRTWRTCRKSRLCDGHHYYSRSRQTPDPALVTMGRGMGGLVAALAHNPCHGSLTERISTSPLLISTKSRGVQFSARHRIWSWSLMTVVLGETKTPGSRDTLVFTSVTPVPSPATDPCLIITLIDSVTLFVRHHTITITIWNKCKH